MERLLTVKETASLLRIHEVHLRRLISDKRIKHFRIDGVGIRFRIEDIQKMIDESEVQPIDWDQKARELVNG